MHGEGPHTEREEREHREGEPVVVLAEREAEAVRKEDVAVEEVEGSWNVWWKSHQSTHDVK